MAYTPQFYPGSTSVGINRRKHMSGNVDKLRDIPEADVVAAMGHRALVDIFHSKPARQNLVGTGILWRQYATIDGCSSH